MAKLPLIEPFEPPTCMFCGMRVGQHAGRAGRQHDGGAGRFGQAADGRIVTARAAAGLDRDPLAIAAISLAASVEFARSPAGAKAGSAGRPGNAARLTVSDCGWVLSGSSR